MNSKIIELINRLYTEFSSNPILEKWFPYLIALNLLFILATMSFYSLLNNKNMKDMMKAHGFGSKDDNKDGHFMHYHNYDKMQGNFKLKKRDLRDIVTAGSHSLIIPNGRIKSMNLYKNDLCIEFNEANPIQHHYKAKKIPSDWIKRRVSKSQLLNYSGNFIIGNMMSRTNNIVCLEINLKEADNCYIKYLFDSGTTITSRIKAGQLISVLDNKGFISNLVFFSQCEWIQLI